MGKLFKNFTGGLMMVDDARVEEYQKKGYMLIEEDTADFGTDAAVAPVQPDDAPKGKGRKPVKGEN